MLNGNVDTPGITRKCPVCEGDCVVDAGSLDSFVYFRNHFYHEECFQKAVERNSTKPTQIKALEQYPKLKQESKDRLTEAYEEDKLYCFLLRYYGLASIPSYFWKKLCELTQGKYQRVSVAVPWSHLYDMWRRKANYLNKVDNDNRTKGKVLEPEVRLHYDLAILLNKYDSYLRFLEKEKVKEESLVEAKPVVKVGSIPTYKAKLEDPDEDNIDELIDEVFG